MDLPSWLHAALTAAATAAFAFLLLMPRIGLALLRRNPTSEIGLWLVARGSASRAVLDEVAMFLPAPARRLMESIPAVEINVPDGAKVTITAEEPASVDVTKAKAAP